MNTANNHNSTQDMTFLANLDLFITTAYAAELVINACANWIWPFLTNPWSIIDLVVVLLSFVSLAGAGMSVRVILLLRCFRVIRIFGKIPSVTKIFSALFRSLVPMINSFFIIFIIAAVCT